MIKHAKKVGSLMLPKSIRIAILIGTVIATTILATEAIVPKQAQAQNATEGGNMTTQTTNQANSNNNNSTMAMGSNSSTLAAGHVNATGVGTFAASGYIAGLILPVPPAAGDTTTPSTVTNSSATNATTLASVVPAKTFILSGAWHIRAESGKISFLDIRFTKVHLDASNRHIHEIMNFRPAAAANSTNTGSANANTSLRLNANGTTTITGLTDVSLNHAVTWTNVKTVIVIDKLSTITIMLDPKETSNHFLGQSIYGTVNMLKDGKGNSIMTFPRP
jgi:hypothetical protein